MPAYNEEKRIGLTLQTYSDYFEKVREKSKIDYEILIVINNTTDNTENIVKKFSAKNKRIKYINLKPGGKGYAVMQGFKHIFRSKTDFIGFVDADLATLPDSFYRLIEAMQKDSSLDAAIASRSHPESLVLTSKKRSIMSKGFNSVVRAILLIPYHDTQCGAKLFTKRAIKKILSLEDLPEWAFDVYLLYEIHKAGFKIKEVPTVWQDKAGSKINLIKVPFQMFSAVVRLRLINSPFNFIVKLYNKLPENLKIHNL